jgi:hypothetical protein
MARASPPLKDPASVMNPRLYNLDAPNGTASEESWNDHPAAVE